jgi:hypothetical protein
VQTSPPRPPRSLAELDRARSAARALLRRRAGTSALASLVPVPGFALLLDVGMLSEVLPRISERFAVSHDDIVALDSVQRRLVNRTIRNLGPTLVGKVLTKGLIVSAARVVGLRLSARQAARVVPVAGSVLAAAIGYFAFVYLGNRHIDQCYEVARALVEASPRRGTGAKRTRRTSPASRSSAAPRTSRTRPAGRPSAAPRTRRVSPREPAARRAPRPRR